MTQKHWKEGEGCGVLYLSLICLRKTKTKKTKKQKTKKNGNQYQNVVLPWLCLFM